MVKHLLNITKACGDTTTECNKILDAMRNADNKFPDEVKIFIAQRIHEIGNVNQRILQSVYEITEDTIAGIENSQQ